MNRLFSHSELYFLFMGIIPDYWNVFLAQNPEFKGVLEPPAYYFCDNQVDADACAELVVQKVKQATSPSVWWFRQHREPFPKVGDLGIVTNWEGTPKAIIRTVRVEIVKFNCITEEYAKIEGEGDKSLAYWREVHWKYYKNERKEFGSYPSDSMEVVCEYFETIG